MSFQNTIATVTTPHSYSSNNAYRIGITTFEQTRKFRVDMGSSRIRAHWLIKHWRQAELFTLGRMYDCVIFQKVYWLDYARHFSGLKILDLCDPDFLNWRCPFKQMMDYCDAVTTSTEPLAQFARLYTSKPVRCVPDRLDLQWFDGLRKTHQGLGGTKTVAWYGYSTNFPMLEAAIPALLKLGLETLIVIADPAAPYQLPSEAQGRIRLVNLSWDLKTVNANLLGADLVINWRSAQGRWRFKSNNKTISAWALGLPVAHDECELASLMTESSRVAEADKRLEEVRDQWDVRDSVREYVELIDELERSRQRCAEPVSAGPLESGLRHAIPCSA
jgi:hypothetical protein